LRRAPAPRDPHFCCAVDLSWAWTLSLGLRIGSIAAGNSRRYPFSHSLSRVLPSFLPLAPGPLPNQITYCAPWTSRRTSRTMSLQTPGHAPSKSPTVNAPVRNRDDLRAANQWPSRPAVSRSANVDWLVVGQKVWANEADSAPRRPMCAGWVPSGQAMRPEQKSQHIDDHNLQPGVRYPFGVFVSEPTDDRHSTSQFRDRASPQIPQRLVSEAHSRRAIRSLVSGPRRGSELC